MRLPIPPQKQKIFDPDEFEDEEVDCADCKYYHDLLIAGEHYVDCELNFMCAKELLEDE